MTQSALRSRLPRLMLPADHPLLTVRSVAAKLGCSEMTIRRRIYARQFPAVKIGRKTMVPREFVDELLAAASAGHTVVLEEFATAWLASRGATS
jgi:excisionase family DNA binding protein